ncbi:MAG TPA: fatty acid desaturase, partial [Caulifigura sp.]|nr:fatty acid desaturase [Caulifigura sp.]
LSHLHHHRRLLADDDLEGAAAHGTLWQALASGPPMQCRLWWWAWRTHPALRLRLAWEGAGILLLIAAAIFAVRWSAIPIVYVGLAVAGSWVFPVVTAYIPHDGRGDSALTRTRLFRGRLVQWIALHHLYHLEHHLYPAVPHHHWQTLARRLDARFLALGLLPQALETQSRKSEGDGR